MTGALCRESIKAIHHARFLHTVAMQAICSASADTSSQLHAHKHTNLHTPLATVNAHNPFSLIYTFTQINKHKQRSLYNWVDV